MRAATAGIVTSNDPRGLAQVDKAARLREFAAYKEQFYAKPTEDFMAVDQADAHDPQAVTEFAGQVQRHMQNTESRHLP